MSQIKRSKDIDIMSLNRAQNENIAGDKELYPKTFVSSTLIDNSKILIQAAKTGNEALIKKLLEAGVPYYVTDQFGCNSFYYAARYNHVKLLSTLLESGSSINGITKMKRTALQIAAYHGHNDCVKFLLKHKANVNLTDSLGMSALHWASENGHLETVRTLLFAGADISLVNNFGKTAYCLAMRKNHYEICELVQERFVIDKSRDIVVNNKVDGNEKNLFKPCTAVFIPDKKTGYSVHQEPVPNIPQEDLRKDGIKNVLKSDVRDNTIKLFEQHGIKLLPVDKSTIINSALKRGQTAVLIEAGKLALKKTEPNIIRPIASTSNDTTVQSPPKKAKIEDENASFEKKSAKSDVHILGLNNTKIIKIDAKELVNLTANKKLIIRQSKSDTSQTNEATQKEENPKITEQQMDPKLISDLELQLKKKTNLLKDMKKQLEISLQLAKYYKARCETKEREAALYKTQLINLSKMLTKSGIKLTRLNS